MNYTERQAKEAFWKGMHFGNSKRVLAVICESLDIDWIEGGA